MPCCSVVHGQDGFAGAALRSLARATSQGWLLVAAAGLALQVVAVAALGAIADVRVLPHEVAFLGMGLRQIGSHHHDHSLVGFIVHNRVAFSGILFGTGVLYLRLAHGPLRGGQPWAWWTLATSGSLGVASYLSHIAFGYRDPVHGLGSLGIGAALAVGLARRRRGLLTPRSLRATARAARPRSWRVWHREERLGWLLVLSWALATIGAGALVLLVGMWRVFVPEDLLYMGAGIEDLRAVNANLLPFIAHDRTGFGGALVAMGIASLGLVLFELRPRPGGPAPTLAAVWAIAVASVILVHPAVGYNSLSHLLPFVLKDALFPLGCALLLRRQSYDMLGRLPSPSSLPERSSHRSGPDEVGEPEGVGEHGAAARRTSQRQEGTGPRDWLSNGIPNRVILGIRSALQAAGARRQLAGKEGRPCVADSAPSSSPSCSPASSSLSPPRAPRSPRARPTACCSSPRAGRSASYAPSPTSTATASTTSSSSAMPRTRTS
jgi:hypothetical protein